SLHAGDVKNAKKFFEQLIREHAGTAAAAEAVFRLGLLLFRQGEHAASAPYFEKYLVLQSDKNFAISSLYWLWRARQKLEHPKSVEAAKELIERYPLSYFALRAMYETNGQKLVFTGDRKERL